MIQVKVGGVPEHFNLPWRLLEEDEAFQKHLGFELIWTDIHGGTGDMVKKLADRSLDACVLLTEGITKAIAEGLEAEIINNYVKSSLKWGVHVPYQSDLKNENDLDPKKHVFAISRKGSGSHLMAFVMAENKGWDKNDLQFLEVGSLDGGLKALEHREAHIFLWEKFTTHPYTLKKRCRYVGEVPTPWPCFSVAAGVGFLTQHRDLFQEILKKVMSYAAELKNNDSSYKLIASRYELEEEQVKQWLSETEWNVSLVKDDEMYSGVKTKLKQLGVID